MEAMLYEWRPTGRLGVLRAGLILGGPGQGARESSIDKRAGGSDEWARPTLGDISS